MKKQTPNDHKKLELMEKVVRSSFGINAKLDYSKWPMEQDKIVIHDIDFNEDLLEILSRLRNEFYIDLDVELSEPDPSTKRQYPILNIELILR